MLDLSNSNADDPSSIGAKLPSSQAHLYAARLDVVVVPPVLGRGIAHPLPHRGGVMRDAGFGLPGIHLLGTSVNRPPESVPKSPRWHHAHRVDPSEVRRLIW